MLVAFAGGLGSLLVFFFSFLSYSVRGYVGVLGCSSGTCACGAQLARRPKLADFGQIWRLVCVYVLLFDETSSKQKTKFKNSSIQLRTDQIAFP